MNNVNSVELTSPPRITTAIGCSISCPGMLPGITSGKSATYDVILDLVDKGRDAMPTFKDTLTDQQKEDVIAFVPTL